MKSLTGEAHGKVDSKGRLVLPSLFKKQLDDDTKQSFVVRKDIFENCIVAYPADEWDEQMQQIRKVMNPWNKKHNAFLRQLSRGTALTSLDNNSRISIPKRLLDSVGISKDIILIGSIGKLEIWDKYNYENSELSYSEMEKLTEEVVGGNLLL